MVDGYVLVLGALAHCKLLAGHSLEVAERGVVVQAVDPDSGGATRFALGKKPFPADRHLISRKMPGRMRGAGGSIDMHAVSGSKDDRRRQAGRLAEPA